MSIRPNKTIALLTVTKKWKWPKWWTSLISGEVNCGISIQWESIQPLKGMKWYLLWCGWILQIVVVVQSLSHVLPNKLQNARLPCLSLSFRVCSNSCPLNWWYYLTLSYSADPFYFFLQFFGESGSFPMSQPLASGGQSTGPSASASVLLVSIYSRLISFRIDWFDLLAAWSKSESHSVISDYIVRGILWPQNTGVGSHSLLQGIFPTLGSNPDLWHCRWTLYLLNHQGSPACCPRNSQESSLAPLSKNISSSVLSLLYGLTLTSEHHYLKNHFSDYTNNVGHVISLLFNMLSRFVIVFLQRTNHLFISWLQTPSAVIFKPKKIKSVTVSTFSSCICHEFIGLETMILVF